VAIIRQERWYGPGIEDWGEPDPARAYKAALGRVLSDAVLAWAQGTTGTSFGAIPPWLIIEHIDEVADLVKDKRREFDEENPALALAAALAGGRTQV